jgi:hypothetical protein
MVFSDKNNRAFGIEYCVRVRECKSSRRSWAKIRSGGGIILPDGQKSGMAVFRNRDDQLTLQGTSPAVARFLCRARQIPVVLIQFI